MGGFLLSDCSLGHLAADLSAMPERVTMMWNGIGAGMKAQFLEDLVLQSPMFVAQRWVIDRTPHMFGNDHIAYVRWKEEFAQHLGVDGRALTIVGSAGVGISLNPHKQYAEFHDESDIDVAVISSHHFDVAWHELRTLGARLYALTPKQRASVDEHVKKYVYYGAIDTRSLLLIFPFGAAWSKALAHMQKLEASGGREVNIRIYRDYESLSGYHVSNLRRLREAQLMAGGE